jgi:hypothetical protein
MEKTQIINIIGSMFFFAMLIFGELKTKLAIFMTILFALMFLWGAL